ncbi:MAG: tetratricopeptide repeat protein [Coleofasciculus sp. B1-GNL1-01]|uniref:tetratricopeptide repeat protein n=1 Tax=Coleofasciculus sp. B1-GNL1-01 TaxID=3068484 RepID=UPI0032FC39AB
MNSFSLSLLLTTTAILAQFSPPSIAAKLPQINPKSVIPVTQLLVQEANDFDYWFDRCYELTGEEALEACDNAIAINSNDASIWYNRGTLLMTELQRYEDAVASFDKAVEINPNYLAAWDNRGVALGQLGQYKDALASHDRALEIDDKQARVWLNRGVTLYLLQRYEEALTAFERAIELDPDYEQAQRNRDLVREQLGR